MHAARAASRVASGAAAAAAGACVSAPTTSSCDARPARLQELDVRPAKAKSALESMTINTTDDSWVLAERVNINKGDVQSAMHDLVALGHADGLLLADVRGSTSDDESVESVGHDADALIELAEARPAARRPPPRDVEPLADLVFDMLSDPGIQRECLRYLQGSALMRQALTRQPGSGAAPLPCSVVLTPGAYAAAGGGDQAGDANPIALVAGAVADGLRHLGGWLSTAGARLGEEGRKLGRAFDALGARVAAALRGDDGPSDADRWAGGMVTLAVAVFAIIALRRVGVAVPR